MCRFLGRLVAHSKAVAALTVLCALILGQPAIADVVVPYNEYSASPTIGRGNGTSTDPRNRGYGAMRIFIRKVTDYTSALPAGQKVIFQPNQQTGRAWQSGCWQPGLRPGRCIPHAG